MPCWPLKNTAAISTYTGRRAPQDMKGTSRPARIRSRRDSSDRVASTAGTVQPNPITMGRKAAPGRPTTRMTPAVKTPERIM